jgi:hypothetical protein
MVAYSCAKAGWRRSPPTAWRAQANIRVNAVAWAGAGNQPQGHATQTEDQVRWPKREEIAAAVYSWRRTSPV